MREHTTHDDARAALVRTSAQATRAGKSALLVASRNDDVRVMNELAREAVRAAEPNAIGEERVYATDFGERTFGIGEVLVGRERAHGGVNGDLYTLAAHRDDGRLELVRRRTASTFYGTSTNIVRSTTATRRRRIVRKAAPSMPSSP